MLGHPSEPAPKPCQSLSSGRISLTVKYPQERHARNPLPPHGSPTPPIPEMSHSGLGMGLFMHILEFFDRVMCIDLGSRQAGMPQQLLDRVQIGAAIGKMRGKS